MGFNNEMTEGAALNQALSKRFGVQGAAAPNIASELFPMVPMEGPTAPPEYGFLRNELAYQSFLALAATVAVKSHVGLDNGSGSGILAVVDRIELINLDSNPQAFLIGQDIGTVTKDTTSRGYPRDRRAGASNTSGLISWTRAATSIHAYELYYPVTANGRVIVEGPWIMGPGSILWASSAADNQDCYAAFFWRERAVTEGELQGAVSS